MNCLQHAGEGSLLTVGQQSNVEWISPDLPLSLPPLTEWPPPRSLFWLGPGEHGSLHNSPLHLGPQFLWIQFLLVGVVVHIPSEWEEVVVSRGFFPDLL